jgi:hypothetical protein
MNSDDQLRYPAGKFIAKDSYTADELKQYIDTIEALPKEVEKTLHTLSQNQLDTPYRDGGWTARQVIHHISDSHINAYVRTKWLLTESTPVIKAYEEKKWAETPETRLDPLISIELLKALHVKWTSLLRRLEPGDFRKSFVHPETGKHVSLERMVAMYAWHGEHHVAHLRIVANKP